MRKIILATSNLGKIAEFQALFSSLPYEIAPQKDLNIGDVEETGLTFVENAIIKARHAAQCSGLPAIADDSGLVVDALGGEPGIYSARYAGEHRDAQACIEKLLFNLQDISTEKRQAYFHCSLVYMRHAKDPSPIIAQGICSGVVLDAPRGEYGFGYDPVIFIPEHNCSMAELPMSVKNQISHRSKALKELLMRVSQL
jgi:XTP/dITP diphosphohydrolase